MIFLLIIILLYLIRLNFKVSVRRYHIGIKYFDKLSYVQSEGRSTLEDRNKPRIIFHVSASLDFHGHTINGNVENLSISGMLINTTDLIPENAEANLTVYLSGSSSELTLNMNCEVIRKEPHGIAVKFTQMDIDSYIHLRNIIEFNKMDEYKLIKEFEESDPGTKV